MPSDHRLNIEYIDPISTTIMIQLTTLKNIQLTHLIQIKASKAAL